MSVLLEFSMTPLDKGESVSAYVSRSLDIIDKKLLHLIGVSHYGWPIFSKFNFQLYVIQADSIFEQQ